MSQYVLSEELKRAVQQVVLQFLNSFQPRPKRGRRLVRRGGGTPAPADDTIRYGRVVVPIPAATNTRTAGWAVVEAAVSVCDNDTGEEIDPDNPITITNKRTVQYEVDTQVKLRGSVVEDGGCYPEEDSFWDEIEAP